MTTIMRTSDKIICDGHAGDKICCAMLTALTVSLVENITERMGIEAEYSLTSGYFDITLSDLPTEAISLIDAYWYSLQSLRNSYPDNFCITSRGSE